MKHQEHNKATMKAAKASVQGMCAPLALIRGFRVGGMRVYGSGFTLR